jgi:hypothetical protein
MTTTGLLVALCGLTAGQCWLKTDAEIPRPHWVIIPRPHWVIIATVVNRHTGKPIKQGRLEGSTLEFDDQSACGSILDLIGPIVSDNFVVVLKCEKTAALQARL